MPASKPNTRTSSADQIGKTDLALVDAHVIRSEEYDEVPELTDEMVARSVPGSDPAVVRRSGRPRAEKPKRLVSIRLDQDVLEAMRATGPGWQTRINDAARAWLETKAKAE